MVRDPNLGTSRSVSLSRKLGKGRGEAGVSKDTYIAHPIKPAESKQKAGGSNQRM